MKKTFWVIFLLHFVSTGHAKDVFKIKASVFNVLDTTKRAVNPTFNSKNIDSLNKVNSILFNQNKTKAFYKNKTALIQQLISIDNDDTTHLKLILNDIGSIERDNVSLRTKAFKYIIKNTKPFILDSTQNKNKLSFYRGSYSRALIRLGRIQSSLNDFQPAIQNLYEALELQKKHGNTWSQATILAELARLYDNLGNSEMSYNYNRKILQHHDLEGTYHYGYALKNMAQLLIERKDSLRYAINLCYKSEAIFRSFTDDYWPQSIASNYVAIGDAYFLLNKEDSAFFYHKKAVKMFIEDTGFSNDVWSYAYHIEANLYFKSKQYKKAISSATKGIKHGIASSYLSGIQESYRIRSKSFKAINNYKRALADHEFFLLYQDSIESLNKTKMAFRYELEYEYKNQKIIDRKNNQKRIFQVNQEAKLDSEKQEKLMLLISIVLFVVILISIFIGVNYRQNKKLSKSLKEKNELIKESLKQKEMFMKEIHHRVKNNMQMVSSVLRLKATATKNDEVRKELLDSQSRIFSMSLAHKLMYENNNFEKINIIEYAEEIVRSVNSTQNQGQTVKFNFIEKEVLINVEQAQAVGFVLHELVLNSIKHAWGNSSNKTITIGLEQKNELIELKYKDNGKGLPSNFNFATVNSMGLKLVRSFVERQLKGTILFTTSNGASITLAFTPRA